MARGDQHGQPSPTRAAGNLRPVAVGCLSFVGCFALSLFATTVVRDYALRDLPRAEVYEALYRDGLAVQWSCGGWAISFVGSLLVAAATAQWARGNGAEPSTGADRPRE